MTPDTPVLSNVLIWNRLACDAIYYTKKPPTLAARSLAMVHTAMYDAWTAYTTTKELSTTWGDRFQRPEVECTWQNREKAYSHAAYTMLEALFGADLPAEHKTMFKQKMKLLGYNAGDTSMDVTTPQGIGNLSAKLVLDCRKGDGSNQESGYTDYSGYKPVNPPPPERLTVVDRWQPQLDDDHNPQQFMTPQWGLVKPFALTWGGQFRPEPPAESDSNKFENQIKEIIRLSESLTEGQKLSAEYWAGMHEDQFEDNSCIDDHKYWTTPPAQCCRIGHYIAKKNGFQNTYAIKFFFALTNALFDASIAAWDAKQYYDYCRPDSVIHELYDEKTFKAWGGPCRGGVEMEGEGWYPYLLNSPPFAEYVSGHSTFSRAMAEIITCFCGTNDYGEEVIIPAKTSKIEPDCTPAQDYRLYWRTLHDASDDAGMSRRYGGIHFEDGDLRGRELGKKVALSVWEKVTDYWAGKLD